MGQPPITREKVFALLAEESPLSSAEMAERLNISRHRIDSAIALVRAAEQKQMYIAGWKRNYGTRGRFGAQWALGDKRDVPKPKSDRIADWRRYKEKMGVVINLKARAKRGKASINPYAVILGIKL